MESIITRYVKKQRKEKTNNRSRTLETGDPDAGLVRHSPHNNCDCEVQGNGGQSGRFLLRI